MVVNVLSVDAADETPGAGVLEVFFVGSGGAFAGVGDFVAVGGEEGDVVTDGGDDLVAVGDDGDGFPGEADAEVEGLVAEEGLVEVGGAGFVGEGKGCVSLDEVVAADEDGGTVAEEGVLEGDVDAGLVGVEGGEGEVGNGPGFFVAVVHDGVFDGAVLLVVVEFDVAEVDTVGVAEGDVAAEEEVFGEGAELGEEGFFLATGATEAGEGLMEGWGGGLGVGRGGLVKGWSLVHDSAVLFSLAPAGKVAQKESVELQYMIFGKSNKGQNEKKS